MAGMSASLRGLAAATNTDPMATDSSTLRARATVRKQTDDDQHTALIQAMTDPAMHAQSAMNDAFGKGRANIGGMDDLWGPWYEAVQEAGERQGAPVKLGGMTGLTTDTGPLLDPVSMMGLKQAVTKGRR